MEFDPPCTSCRWHNDGRCGAYDMPAELARSRPMLCGILGEDHHPSTHARDRAETLILVLGVLALAVVLGVKLLGKLP